MPLAGRSLFCDVKHCYYQSYNDNKYRKYNHNNLKITHTQALLSSMISMKTKSFTLESRLTATVLATPAIILSDRDSNRNDNFHFDTTTYDNYIYDLEDEDEIFKDVVNALQNGALKPRQDNETKWNQIIIDFEATKKQVKRCKINA